MNTNRDVTFGSGPGVPSGWEVESAALHVPVADHTLPPQRSDIRGKLDDLKTRSLSKVHEVQNKVHDVQDLVVQRTSVMKNNLRIGMNDSVTKMQSSMRTSPTMWAGIAAGSGLAIGLIGRVMAWRSKQHRHMPQLVIIETSC
jgi:ElaB/YqjD/DUF883 family membrane-anchored ribosome-binding protein